VGSGSSQTTPSAHVAALAGDADLGDRIRFVVELDRLKQILRHTVVTDGTRRENTAEHSWHVALMALVLADAADAADDPIDPLRVARLLLVHDVVEIDAGDTFIYDTDGQATKAERERAAADRLFGMLPAGQGDELRAWWLEFEDGTSPEARFARSLDRLQPLLLNYASAGQAWRDHGITAERVRAVNAAIGDGSRRLWELAQHLIDDAVAQGWLPAGDA
jgi:putative hydrolase of HD superfamily